MSAPFTGLTWDHPRGFQALEAAARANGPVHWETHPLEGFESAPVAELCERYDLIVLDHPHLGEAVSSGCLIPLDQILEDNDLQRIATSSVGLSYASYQYQGHQWALPLDAATQVMAARTDLMTTAVPETWEQVIALSQTQGGVALALAGPHALLSLLSIAAALDPKADLREGDRWIDAAVSCEAIKILATLASHSPPSIQALNPIGMLEHMTTSDDVRMCPLVYGYVNYANPTLSRALSFLDAPRLSSGASPGSILGGTGIAISRHCKFDDTLREHLLWLLSDSAQTDFIPQQAGQPSALKSWRDPQLNQRWNGFYANTLHTLRHASIRPRHNGYIAFQTQASARLREGLEGGVSEHRLAQDLTTLFERSHRDQGRKN
ncbi:extracellular solute-binding protein [Halomonas huangheensis]|uniref:ABC transporter substrate-binding protein n=1 Tax=Halomonas huangheensis TaxID=1178482 RepID=W1N2A1_9GAMM|nr:extracellular solute-binding protein [Halomonas huangheensis]ALM51197.1 hypothetical protein AR456_01975 [Halomonas huangheensis]ERL49614.1 hypothetical protein BJB45_00415 [Halomonas huangheensis]